MEKGKYLEAFVQELSRFLAEPGEHLPSVKCLSRYSLYAIFRDVRGVLKQAGMTCRIAQGELLNALSTMSLLRRVPVESTGGPIPGVAYYSVGFAPVEKSDVHPMELLQAAYPEGVICYFTALSFHGLTTQIPSHHHVGKVREERESVVAWSAERAGGETSGHERPYSKMGRALFRYGGVSYYGTTRSTTVLRSYGLWHLNSKSIVRVATLEQALVDSLHKPMRCGGPSVVLEAWEEAIEGETLDQEKLSCVLREVSVTRLVRQVGYLMDEMGGEVSACLTEVLEGALDETDRSDKGTASPLFPDYAAEKYDDKWHLMVPEW